MGRPDAARHSDSGGRGTRLDEPATDRTPAGPTHTGTTGTHLPAVGSGRADEAGAPPAAAQLPEQRTADGKAALDDEHDDAGRSGRRTRRRGRGVPIAVALTLAGMWVGTVPYFGPYAGFGYDASPLVDDPVLTPDRVWLTALPALAILVGGVLLVLTRQRAAAGSGALAALAGGVWLVVGPAISQLWGAPGPGREIGAPIGGPVLRSIDQLVVFYGVGAVVIALAAFALGRILRSARD